MNWRAFWKAVDRFGESGAPRCEWRWALGDEFARCEPLLKAHGRTLADLIHDPDDPTQAMEVVENRRGGYDAHSTEIPPHRPPIVLAREDLITLTLNAPAVSRALAPEMGLAPGGFRSRCPAGLDEMGVYSLPGKPVLPVFLLLPNGASRAAHLREALRKLQESILLVTSRRGMDEAALTLARGRNVVIRSLDQEPARVLAGILPGAPAAGKSGIKPAFAPRPGWTWEMLELDFSHERFVATIAGEQFKGRWEQQGVRVLHDRMPTDFIKVLGQLARRERLEQSRKDAAGRKRVSRFREALRALFPLVGEPIRNGAARFRVWTRSATR